jgi:predicted CoA-substrate-specific enzyme activase
VRKDPENMSCVAGLDVGSALVKAVIMENGQVLSYSVTPAAGKYGAAVDKVFNEALDKAHRTVSDIEVIGASGLGVPFVSLPCTRITEISCQSRGTNFLLPTVRTLIEVGNQASRVIKVTKTGKVADATASDKCAAGSGRVLQVIARVLKVNQQDMGMLSLKAGKPAKFTTGCAVFLETEAISRVAEGTPKEDILAGLHQALAGRISAMALRMRIEKDVGMTGGGAKDIGLVKTTERILGMPLLVPEEPLITGAIGAALIAKERAQA